MVVKVLGMSMSLGVGVHTCKPALGDLGMRITRSALLSEILFSYGGGGCLLINQCHFLMRTLDKE